MKKEEVLKNDPEVEVKETTKTLEPDNKIVETKKEENDLPDYFPGIIKTLVKLRSTPMLGDDNIRYAVSPGIKVKISRIESTNRFYRVELPSGDAGYCMKRYVETDEV